MSQEEEGKKENDELHVQILWKKIENGYQLIAFICKNLKEQATNTFLQIQIKQETFANQLSSDIAQYCQRQDHLQKDLFYCLELQNYQTLFISLMHGMHAEMFQIFQLMSQGNSPKKRQNSPGKYQNRQKMKDSPNKLKQSSSTGSEISQGEPALKKYASIQDEPAPNVSKQGLGKKRSGLGLIEGEQDEQQAQNTHVEADLFKVIMLMAKSRQLAAVGGLLGAFAIHLIVGAIYRWNMITGYVSIYYQTQWITPIGAPMGMLCAGLTMRIGAKISEMIGSRWVLGIGVFLSGVATVVASRTQSFGAFLLFHNVLYGLSAGLLFLPPLMECHKFFPKLKLITNSIVLTGTGLGAVLFGANNIQCIQKDNETTILADLELKNIVDSQFPGCFLTMGVYVFLIGFAGVLMMVPMILRNEQRARDERQLSIQERSGNFCKTEWEAFHSRVFWIIAAIIFLTSCGNYYVIMNYKNLLAAQHQKKVFMYWILISGALGNGLTRLIWGFLFSRVGFKVLFCVAGCMNLSSFAVIMATNNQTAYIVFYTINSISLGGLMVIFPNVAMIVFGKKIGEKVYAYYWLAFSLSNFFQFAITLVLTNNPITSDDYSEVLFFFSFCVLAALFICVRELLQGPWKNSLDLVEFERKKKVRKYSS